MTHQDLTLAVIVASVRQGRFGPVIAEWLRTEAKQHGRFDIDLIDLADTSLPTELPPSLEGLRAVEERPEPMVRLAGRLAAADAFVIVTPEYNHSFPASIKNLIDWHFTEWQAKPVGFVSYGGYGGGLRAVEQLRLVFTEMHSVNIRDMVSFDQHWTRFDETGQLTDPDGPNTAARTLLDQLTWWAAALNSARQTAPYGLTA
jgi:NAD(P)H-dependent FMN reductase